MAKGKIKYIPVFLLDELQDIKREKQIHTDIEAMQKLVKYSRVSREMERLINLDWSKKKPLKPVEWYYKKKK
jgi:Zn-dependent peptidase ImmA (M78 family)